MKTILTLSLLLLLSGCVIREYQNDHTDPNGIEQTRYYREIYFMTDVRADSVRIVTPDGAIIEINAPVQESQDVKVISPALGIMETKSKGK